jgi:hypothetical protein
MLCCTKRMIPSRNMRDCSQVSCAVWVSVSARSLSSLHFSTAARNAWSGGTAESIVALARDQMAAVSAGIVPS